MVVHRQILTRAQLTEMVSEQANKIPGGYRTAEITKRTENHQAQLAMEA